MSTRHQTAEGIDALAQQSILNSFLYSLITSIQVVCFIVNRFCWDHVYTSSVLVLVVIFLSWQDLYICFAKESKQAGRANNKAGFYHKASRQNQHTLLATQLICPSTWAHITTLKFLDTEAAPVTLDLIVCVTCSCCINVSVASKVLNWIG